MGKGNIVYHNLRMNLDNEQHRRVHLVLSDLNTDIHKSVNQFLINAADSYISRLEGRKLTRGEKQPEECSYVTKEDLEKIRREIKDELQREIIVTLGTALACGKVIQIPQTIPAKEAERQTDSRMEIEADETTVGLASSWG